jgi:hypothetical protein
LRAPSILLSCPTKEMTALDHKLGAFALATFGALVLAGVYAERHRAPDQP